MQEHRCSCTVVPLLKQFNSFEFWKGCGVSRSIYLTTFFGRTSIIYGVTNIVFSLKQHIAPSSAPCLTRKYHYFSTGVMANRNMLYIIPTRRKMYRSSVFTESWRSCPTAFLLRSGEFIPRHPVHIHFSRCARGAICPLIPYLAIF